MAGLPVLVMGANAAVVSLTTLVQTAPNLTIVTWCARTAYSESFELNTIS